MNYYEVAPLAYLGTETSTLVYNSSMILYPGQAVLIPLRSKNVVGVILSSTKKPGFITKEILGKILEKGIINHERLELAQWISDYYAASLASVLQAFIPSGITKKRHKGTNLQGNKKIIRDDPPTLKKDQDLIVRNILNNQGTKPHLLFGITGSGKTEVYLRLIEDVMEKSQQAIVLVPEISLTPMMLEGFTARFGNKVVVLHSYLKETERYTNWKAIFDNKKTVIIGSRSALFAPCHNLGLIIIDEEHETSYKQDQTPKYQTIKVAEKLSQLTGAKLVLGSATPSINSYYLATKNEYNLHLLNKRIIQNSMPPVEIIDMRNEFKYGNKSIFSDKLKQEINNAIHNKKQVLLFINRRGMSTFVNCRDCGYVSICPNCDIPLTFHYQGLSLVCHHCGHIEPAPALCPKCHSTAIKYFGAGTQRVEQELKSVVNKDNLKISRMDYDTTQKRGSHDVLYKNFAQNNVDILIGTQMITKGWDLANISLVGIISADSIINFPDYNASERTFNLLTQVAGRTGRGLSPGKVILQTYSPDNFAIKAASNHDYVGFYNQEIKNRADLNYPPFTRLIKLLYNDPISKEAENTTKELFIKIKSLKRREIIDVLGPSPAFLPKLAGKYRWQIILKVKNKKEEEFINIVKTIQELIDNTWSIDVDPTGVI